MFFIYVSAPEFSDGCIGSFVHACVRMVRIIHNAHGTPKVSMDFAYE